MTASLLPRHQLLTPDHVCAAPVPERGICWHVYGRREDGSRFAVAARSESSLGAQFLIREEIAGAFFERIIAGTLDAVPSSTPTADYR